MNVKDDLIKIATRTIQKSGIHRLTMRDLASEANIKSSSVMYHFKNKDGLLCELTKIYNDSFFDFLEDINKKNEDPKKRLLLLVDTFESVLNEDKLCLCGMLASENDSLDAITKESVCNFFGRLNFWVEDNLNLLNINKTFAKIIVSSLEGAMLIDKLNQNNNNLSAVRIWIESL